MTMPTIYSRLRKLARGVLKHYEADLTVHDRKACAATKQGDAFIWALRESGTHIALFVDATLTTAKEREERAKRALEYLDAIESVARDMRTKTPLYFLCEATSPQRGHVCKCTYEEARRAIVAARDAAAATVRREREAHVQRWAA